MLYFMDKLNFIGSLWFEFMLNNTIQITVLLSIIFLVSFIFKNNSPVFIYAILFVGLIKTIIPPNIATPFWSIFKKINFPEYVFELNELTINLDKLNTEVTFLNQINFESILFTLWFLGTLFLLSKIIKNEITFDRLFKNSVKLDMKNKISTVLNQKFNLNNVKILQSNEVPCAFTKGYFSPIIFLPSDASNWSNEQFNIVLAHELAHIQRKDIWIITFQSIINIIYFFNPLVWILNSQINFQREKICDDIAMDKLELKPHIYGKTLINSIEDILITKTRLSIVGNGFLFSKKNIFNRFEYIVNKEEGSKISKIGKIQKLAILLLAIFALSLSLFAANTETPKKKNPLNSNLYDKIVDYNEIEIKPRLTKEMNIKFENYISANFSAEAREKYISGRVKLEFICSANGIPLNIKIIKEQPKNSGFGQVAINALKEINLIPGSQNGKNIPVLMRVSSKF